MKYKLFCTIVLTFSMITNAYPYSKCTKYKQLIINAQKAQEVLKSPSGKTLSELQKKYDKARAEYVIYEGISEIKNDYYDYIKKVENMEKLPNNEVDLLLGDGLDSITKLIYAEQFMDEIFKNEFSKDLNEGVFEKFNTGMTDSCKNLSFFHKLWTNKQWNTLCNKFKTNDDSKNRKMAVGFHQAYMAIKYNEEKPKKILKKFKKALNDGMPDINRKYEHFGLTQKFGEELKSEMRKKKECIGSAIPCPDYETSIKAKVAEYRNNMLAGLSMEVKPDINTFYKQRQAIADSLDDLIAYSSKSADAIPGDEYNRLKKLQEEKEKELKAIPYDSKNKEHDALKIELGKIRGELDEKKAEIRIRSKNDVPGNLDKIENDLAQIIDSTRKINDLEKKCNRLKERWNKKEKELRITISDPKKYRTVEKELEEIKNELDKKRRKVQKQIKKDIFKKLEKINGDLVNVENSIKMTDSMHSTPEKLEKIRKKIEQIEDSSKTTKGTPGSEFIRLGKLWDEKEKELLVTISDPKKYRAIEKELEKIKDEVDKKRGQLLMQIEKDVLWDLKKIGKDLARMKNSAARADQSPTNKYNKLKDLFDKKKKELDAVTAVLEKHLAIKKDLEKIKREINNELNNLERQAQKDMKEAVLEKLNRASDDLVQIRNSDHTTDEDKKTIKKQLSRISELKNDWRKRWELWLPVGKTVDKKEVKKLQKKLNDVAQKTQNTHVDWTSKTINKLKDKEVPESRLKAEFKKQTDKIEKSLLGKKFGNLHTMALSLNKKLDDKRKDLAKRVQNNYDIAQNRLKMQKNLGLKLTDKDKLKELDDIYQEAFREVGCGKIKDFSDENLFECLKGKKFDQDKMDKKLHELGSELAGTRAEIQQIIELSKYKKLNKEKYLAFKNAEKVCDKKELAQTDYITGCHCVGGGNNETVSFLGCDADGPIANLSSCEEYPSGFDRLSDFFKNKFKPYVPKTPFEKKLRDYHMYKDPVSGKLVKWAPKPKIQVSFANALVNSELMRDIPFYADHLSGYWKTRTDMMMERGILEKQQWHYHEQVVDFYQENWWLPYGYNPMSATDFNAFNPYHTSGYSGGSFGDWRNSDNQGTAEGIDM
ncbi:MAG: hypothetical protein KAQ98_07635 [Bacteriovoracaceae bacterium]|nr:hypothetical protein [Bacteriovoracaceae bacterium]